MEESGHLATTHTKGLNVTVSHYWCSYPHELCRRQRLVQQPLKVGGAARLLRAHNVQVCVAPMRAEHLDRQPRRSDVAHVECHDVHPQRDALPRGGGGDRGAVPQPGSCGERGERAAAERAAGARYGRRADRKSVV